MPRDETARSFWLPLIRRICCRTNRTTTTTTTDGDVVDAVAVATNEVTAVEKKVEIEAPRQASGSDECFGIETPNHGDVVDAVAVSTNEVMAVEKKVESEVPCQASGSDERFGMEGCATTETPKQDPSEPRHSSARKTSRVVELHDPSSPGSTASDQSDPHRDNSRTQKPQAAAVASDGDGGDTRSRKLRTIEGGVWVDDQDYAHLCEWCARTEDAPRIDIDGHIRSDRIRIARIRHDRPDRRIFRVSFSLHARSSASLAAQMLHLRSRAGSPPETDYPRLLATTCDALARLTALTSLEIIQESTKSVALPPEIGNLHNLTDLTLMFCNARLPPEIGNLHNLRELIVLEGCGSPLPPTVGNLQNLESLYLCPSRSLASLPSELGNLPNLSELKLIGCDHGLIVSLTPILGRLKHLQRLELLSTTEAERRTRSETELVRQTECMWMLAQQCPFLGKIRYTRDSCPFLGEFKYTRDSRLEYQLACKRARPQTKALFVQDPAKLWPLWPHVLHKACRAFPPLGERYEISQADAMYVLLTTGRNYFLRVLVHRNARSSASP